MPYEGKPLENLHWEGDDSHALVVDRWFSAIEGVRVYVGHEHRRRLLRDAHLPRSRHRTFHRTYLRGRKHRRARPPNFWPEPRRPEIELPHAKTRGRLLATRFGDFRRLAESS